MDKYSKTDNFINPVMEITKVNYITKVSLSAKNENNDFQVKSLDEELFDSKAKRENDKIKYAHLEKINNELLCEISKQKQKQESLKQNLKYAELKNILIIDNTKNYFRPEK